MESIGIGRDEAETISYSKTNERGNGRDPPRRPVVVAVGHSGDDAHWRVTDEELEAAKPRDDSGGRRYFAAGRWIESETDGRTAACWALVGRCLFIGDA